MWCWSCGNELFEEDEVSLRFTVPASYTEEEDRDAVLCAKCHVEAINETRKGK